MPCSETRPAAFGSDVGPATEAKRLAYKEGDVEPRYRATELGEHAVDLATMVGLVVKHC